MDFNSGSQVNSLPLAFDYRVEEEQGNGCEGKIIVEAVITEEETGDTVDFSYTFSLEEFIADEPSPLKDDLIYSFISGGINIDTSLSYIYSATMIARDVTSSPDYGPRNLLRFIYCLHNRRRSSIIEAYLNPGSGSEEENIRVNMAIQQSLHEVVVDFIPADKITVDAFRVDVYSGCHCGALSCGNSQCVICLDNLVIGAEIVKLDCGHIYDRECIVKWLNISHYCPICKYELPM
uniref:RING-type E3 ubiquitin transferase n=2 Tax=Brassica oleracea TaxID=3712 RepID=A0A0D3DHQ8_BRAOL